MNSIVNEGFFGDTLVIVEGPGDMGVIWGMQQVCQSDWERKGIIVVPASGKDNIDRLATVFQGLSIPTYIMFDGDLHLQGGDKEESAKRLNRVLLKFVAAVPVDFPPTTIESNWSVLASKLEDQLKEDLGETDFVLLRDAAAASIQHSNPSKILKTAYGGEAFVRTVYGRGQRLTTFEKIVHKIDDLHVSNN